MRMIFIIVFFNCFLSGNPYSNIRKLIGLKNKKIGGSDTAYSIKCSTLDEGAAVTLDFPASAEPSEGVNPASVAIFS